MNSSTKSSPTPYVSTNANPAYGQSGPNSLLGLVWLFVVQFFRSIPFSVRALLRKDIGSMTFTWANIIFASLWVRFLLDGTYSLSDFSPPEAFTIEFLNKENGFYYLGLPFWYIGMFFAQFGKVIMDFIPDGVWTVFTSGAPWESYIPFYLSVLILILGVAQKYNTKRKHDKRLSFDPMSNGKSLYFGGLVDRLKFKNKEQGLFWIEFGLLLALAFILYYYGSDFINYAGFFGIGALSLLIEDQILVFQKRKEIEYRLANEYRATDTQELYEEYQQTLYSQRMATVSFAGSSHAEKPKLEFLPPKGKVSSFFNRPNLDWKATTRVGARYLKYAPVLLIIPLAIWLFTSIPKEIEYVGIVTTERLTLRKKPRIDSRSLGEFTSETVFQITHCEIIDKDGREWCHIVIGSESGYAVKLGRSGTQYMWTEPINYHLIDIGALPFEDNVSTLNGGPLNLRSEPSLVGRVTDSMPDGAPIKILDQESYPTFLNVGDEQVFGVWLKVEYQGQVGYCFSWYLDLARIPSILF